jgi:hypothetical protein
MNRLPTLSRREWLTLSAAGVLGPSLSVWLESLAGAAGDRKRRRSCILLWMHGGPSQMDTFDPKPGHENGGPVKPLRTKVPGLHISEHLPQLARHAGRLALLRSMSTKDADHGRGDYLMHTGHAQGGPIQYPPMGALFAKELKAPDLELPAFVSIAPNRGFAPPAYEGGYLGPQHAPLILGDGGRIPTFSYPGAPGGDYERLLKVQDFDRPAEVGAKQADARLKLLEEVDDEFLRDRATVASLSHRAAYQRAVTLMRSKAARAFRLDNEPAKLRDQYGRNLFGQGCLLARRLVEQGVPFVEVTLAGVVDNDWDSHRDNFAAVKKLCGVLDPAWATLMSDLQDKGLLDTTLIVWAGEFGRTPRINRQAGRDHWARSWSTVLAGGGIKGGQVVGKTTADGMDVVERPIDAQDFLATIALALGIDVKKQNLSNLGRPIRIAEPTAKPIKEVLA